MSRCAYKDAFGVQCSLPEQKDEVHTESSTDEAIARLKRDILPFMSESIERRIRRYYESSSYVGDAAYWMLNYAQACEGRLSVDRVLGTVTKECDALRIEIARRDLHALENAYEEVWG